MKNKLLEEYIRLFGDEPPFPPVHIMKSLVDIKRDGTFEEKMEQFKTFEDEVISQIEDISGEKLSLDHPFFDIDFTEDEEDGIISLKKTFWLIYDSVMNCNTNEMIDLCKSMGMEEVPYQSVPDDQNLPEFDNGYWFKYKTDQDEICNLEILDKGGEILQSGFQIVMNKFLMFSNLKEHFELLKEYSEKIYGESLPIEQDISTILNYRNDKTVCYLSKVKMKTHHILTLRIGNRRFWDKQDSSTSNKSIVEDDSLNEPLQKDIQKTPHKKGFTVITGDEKSKTIMTFRHKDYLNLGEVREDGPYTEYYEEGNRKIEGYYSNGKKDGEWIEYYDSGIIKFERNYKNGEWDGKYVYYYENGQIKFEKNFKDGELVGISTYYKKDGSIKEVKEH